MASNLGTVFVELSLDDKVYKQRLSETLTSTTATAKGIETAWKALGTKSAEMFDAQRKAAQNAYTLIAQSAGKASQEAIRAQEAAAAKISALNKQQFGEQTSLIDKLKANWIAAAATIYGAMKVIGEAKEFIELGAKALAVESSFKIMAKAANVSSEEMVASMKRATQGTIDESDLMQKAVKLMLREYNPEQIERFSKVAVTSAQFMGTTVSEAFDMLGDAIANKMPKALVKGGAVTREQLKLVQEAIKNGADETALFELAMANLELMEKKLQGTQNELILSIQRHKAEMQDLKETIGKYLIVALEKLVGALEGVAAGWFLIYGAVAKAKQGQNEAEAWIVGMIPGLSAYAEGLKKTATAWKTSGDAALANAEKYKKASLEHLTGEAASKKEAADKAEIAAAKKKVDDQIELLKKFKDANRQAVDEATRANAELDVLMARTVSKLEEGLAQIQKKYEDLIRRGADHVKAEQWRVKAIAALYAEEDKETVQHFVNAAKNYEAGYQAMAHEIEEGVRLIESKRRAIGLFSETEEAIMATEQAINQWMIDIEEGFLASTTSIKEFDDTFSGMAQGFKDGINEMETRTQTFRDVGLDAFKTFHDGVKSMISDQVDAFIRGEDAKLNVMQATGKILGDTAGTIAKDMYAKAIEKIISMIGAFIGEGAAASGAEGSMEGGFAGAMVQIGLYLGTAVTAMLAGRGLAQAFKAEGGWVASHPGGGIIHGGSGVRDDVYLGMTPGVRHWGMGGEFVINKESSAKHAALLTAINRDRGHDDGGPINDSWQPLADMLVLGTLASAGHGFLKGGPFGAISEAVAFNIGAIGGAFGGKALASLFAGHAQGGPIVDVGHLFGIDIIDPFGFLPGGRNSFIPPIPYITVPPDWAPDPIEAIRFATDPEAVLTLIRAIIEEPYKQIAKDILTPNKLWSNPIDAVGSAIDLLREVVKKGLGIKHSGGMIGSDERLFLGQTGEGVLSRQGMANLGRLNMGYQEGGTIDRSLLAGPEAIAATYWTSKWNTGLPEDQPYFQAEMAIRQKEIELIKAQGDSVRALAMERWDELQSMDESLRGIQNQIYAEQDYTAEQDKRTEAWESNFKLRIELMKAEGNTLGALNAERFLELHNMSLAGQVIQHKIYALEDAKKAEEELAKAREDAAAATAAALKAESDRRWSLQERLLQAQGRTEELLFLQRFQEMNELKRTQDSYSMSLLMQIYAAEDAAKAAENTAKALDALNDALSKIQKADYVTSYDFRKAVGLTKIRGYDSGGYHPGGLRIVGEAGPEIEWTGPSRIFGNNQIGGLIGGDIVSEVRQLRQDIGNQNFVIAANSIKFAKILDKWDGEGLPTSRDSDSVSWA